MAGERSERGWLRRHYALRGFVEAQRPVVGKLRAVEIDSTEVVHDVPAAKHEDARVPQRSELAPDVDVVVKRLATVYR